LFVLFVLLFNKSSHTNARKRKRGQTTDDNNENTPTNTSTNTSTNQETKTKQQQRLKDDKRRAPNLEDDDDGVFAVPALPPLRKRGDQNDDDDDVDEALEEDVLDEYLGGRDDVPDDHEEPEDGEDLEDEALLMADYAVRPELDVYDADELDPSEYRGMTARQLREANKALLDRDIEEGKALPEGKNHHLLLVLVLLLLLLVLLLH